MSNQHRQTLEEWLAWQEGLHCSEIDLGLDRIRQVAERLGLLKPDAIVITVAGTNGKGSTVAFFESVLLSAGYRVGTYTSPHLIRYNERIRVGGIEATDGQICNAFEQIEAVRGDISLTYFEYGTLAAFLILFGADLDVMVLEVGLGGRLDAVNILDADLAVLTSIGLDHTDWLGEDRESIGFEKAGVFRPGAPAVCGDASPPESVLQHAKTVGAALYVQGEDFEYSRQQSDWQWTGLGQQRFGLPHPSLKGAFQYRNCAAMLMGLELLKERLPVSLANIRQGLISARLPGRFQVLSTQPMLIVDVAHNAQGAQALAEALRGQLCSGKTIAVFSLLKDKEISSILKELSCVFDEWHVAGLENIPRGASMLQMLQRISQAKVDIKNLAGHEDLLTAYSHVMSYAGKEDRVVIFGSFFVVAEILSAYNKAK